MLCYTLAYPMVLRIKYLYVVQFCKFGYWYQWNNKFFFLGKKIVYDFWNTSIRSLY